MQMNSKHKRCCICNTRLDIIKRTNYFQVQKNELIQKLNLLKPGVRAGDYICNKHSKHAKSLPRITIDSEKTLQSLSGIYDCRLNSIYLSIFANSFFHCILDKFWFFSFYLSWIPAGWEKRRPRLLLGRTFLWF